MRMSSCRTLPRTCRQAIDLMGRMKIERNRQHDDLAVALRKYVEDTCEAIKQVDNELKKNGSSLEELLFEIPGAACDQVSWRNLIGRREVIAHKLLTVDDETVYKEAERDFALLGELVSRVFFAPTKTDLHNGRPMQPLLRSEVLHKLEPAVPGELPRIGTSLIFIVEDVTMGLTYLRMGRTEENKLALAGPPGTTMSISVATLEETRRKRPSEER